MEYSGSLWYLWMRAQQRWFRSCEILLSFFRWSNSKEEENKCIVSHRICSPTFHSNCDSEKRKKKKIQKNSKRANDDTVILDAHHSYHLPVNAIKCRLDKFYWITGTDNTYLIQNGQPTIQSIHKQRTLVEHFIFYYSFLRSCNAIIKWFQHKHISVLFF